MVLITTSLLVWTLMTAGLSGSFAWRFYKRRNADDARRFALAYGGLSVVSFLFLVSHEAPTAVLIGLTIMALVAASIALVHGMAARSMRQSGRRRPSSVETAFAIGAVGANLATLAVTGLGLEGLAACLDLTMLLTFVACGIFAARGPREQDRMAAMLCALAALVFSARIGMFAAGLAQSRLTLGTPAIDHASMSYLISVTLLVVLGTILFIAVLQDDAVWSRVQALYDPQTSLLKRPPFFIEAQTKINAAIDQPHVIAICDVDRLGKITAEHGEAVGDAVLARLGRMMWESLPRHALAGRFGGDEIVLFFPNATLETSEPVLKALCARVAAEPWPHGLKVTVSIGQAAFVKGERLDDALVLADAGLQYVKTHGRGAVRTVRPGDFADPMALSAAGGRSVRRIDRSKAAPASRAARAA